MTFLDVEADDFLDRVRAEMPEFWAQVVESQIDLQPPVRLGQTSNTARSHAFCDRCGALVAYGDTHAAWHRKLTIGMHLNAWMVSQTLRAIHALADGETKAEAERGI